MIRFILIIALALSIINETQAQRLFSGQKGVQLTAGAVDSFHLKNGDQQAFAVGLALSSYRNFGNRWVFGIEYLQKKHEYKEVLIPTSQFTAEAGYYINCYASPRKLVLFSIGLSGMAGYESVNWSKELLYDGSTIENKEAALYGGALSLEMETFLSDKIIFLVHARERVLFGSTINKLHLQVGVGLKFIIND